jgi:hypothetical protein
MKIQWKSVPGILFISISRQTYLQKSQKKFGLGSNGAYAPNTMLWVLDAPLNIWSQGWIPRLDCEDDGNLCPVAVVSVLTNMQYLQSPPPPCGCISPKLPQTCQHQSVSIRTHGTHQAEEDNSRTMLIWAEDRVWVSKVYLDKCCVFVAFLVLWCFPCDLTLHARLLGHTLLS